MRAPSWGSHFYASGEEFDAMDDILINYGSAVKALGGGRVGGYLVTFGDETTPDLSEHRDFFEPTTDYDIEDGAKTTTYFHHGLDAKLGVRKLGKVELKADEVGIWAEGILSTRDAYEQEIYKMVEAGKLSWSSGATTHLVRREKVAGKNANRVLNWPISEASLTPNPADYRNSVMAIKSAPLNTDAYDRMIAGEDATPETKASVLGDMTPDVCAAAFDRLSSKLSLFVYQQLWGDSWGGCSMCSDDVDSEDKAPIDRSAVAQAMEEYSKTVLAVLDAMLALPKADAIATKSFLAHFEKPGGGDVVTLLSAMPIKTYLEAVGAIASDADRRIAWYAEQRAVKQGRAISADNLSAMSAVADGMDKAAGTIDEHRKKLRALVQSHMNVHADPAPTKVPTAVAHEFARYLAIGAAGAGATMTL